jgi:hypothetical protein
MWVSDQSPIESNSSGEEGWVDETASKTTVVLSTSALYSAGVDTSKLKLKLKLPS